MAKFTVTHEINTDVEGFWKLFFDKEFNEKLYKDGLGFSDFRLLEQKDSDAGVTRKVTGTPKMTVPGPVAKILGSSFSYVEDGSLDKKSNTWKWSITPSTAADKIKSGGTLRIEAAGPGKVRRIAELYVEAKIFGIGGMIETATEKDLRDGWDKSAVFMNQYLKK